MISLSAFLQSVQENVRRIDRYQLGGDGSGGVCDCIGLVIGAVRLTGGTWPGTHGSNWAARNAMDKLNHIADAGKMFLGEIVYKAKEPGEDGYNLPDRYTSSAAGAAPSPQGEGIDKRDYYHVGVVTSVDPLCITHCTGVQGGIKADTAMGKWRWGGKLKYVDYEGGGGMEEDVLFRATVTAKNGKPVRMRESASTNSDVLEEIPVGQTVDVLDTDLIQDEWYRIRHNGLTGYMMKAFLERLDGGTEEEQPVMGGTVTVKKAELKAARSALMLAVEAIDSLLNEKGE